MDEDNDIFDMFLAMMEQLQTDDPNGRLRMLSKNPRYAADSPGNKKDRARDRKECLILLMCGRTKM